MRSWQNDMAYFFFCLMVFCVLGTIFSKDRDYLIFAVIFAVAWWRLRKPKL